MPNLSQIELNEVTYDLKDTVARQKIPWCIVNSTSTSTAFTATVDGVTKLENGVCFVCVNNKVASASGCTMNVNSLGAKPIYRTDAEATRVTTQFAKNVTWLFIYNESRVTGGCWDLAYLYNTNSTYAGYSFGLGYGVCDTAEATVAKTCAILSYSLSNGGVVSVKFTNTVCANATLNINSKGAKPIYFRGAPIIKEIIRAGDIATFQYYGGYYYLISIDRLGELTNSVSKGAVEGSTILGYSAEEDGDGYHPNIALEQFSLAHGGALGFPIKITGAANTTTYTYSKSDPDLLETTTKNIDKYLTLSLGYSYLANSANDDAIRSKILSVDTDNATITIQSAVSDTALNSATWYLLVPSIASAHASTSGGAGTIASDNASAAIGQGTMAISDGSFAEGFATIAGSESNNNAHAEGCASIASGYASHAEGITTEATGFMSHSEGWLTVASGTASHSEGKETNTSGYASHAEGTGTIANRANQHASGSYNISDAVGSANVRGTYIEIVGNGTSANARSNARTLDWSGNEWVAGKVSAGTVANPASVTADNDLTTKKYVDEAIGDIPQSDWTEADSTDPSYIQNKPDIYSGTGDKAIILGVKSASSVVPGDEVIASGTRSLAVGYMSVQIWLGFTASAGSTTISYNNSSFNSTHATLSSIFEAYVEQGLPNVYIVDSGNPTYAIAITAIDKTNKTITTESAVSNSEITQSDYLYFGRKLMVTRDGAVAFGEGSVVKALNSVAIGNNNTITGDYSTAEGIANYNSGLASHADGVYNLASGDGSHAEGVAVTASGYASHAEGRHTISSNNYTHAEGYGCNAIATSAHAEGYNSVAAGQYSHSEGRGTRANTLSQHVGGEYNVLDTSGSSSTRGAYAEIIGNGTSTSARSNARTLDWSGNEWVAGKVSAGTVANPASVAAANDLTTKQYVDNIVTNKITAPSSPATGSFLVYNGTSWAAQTLSAWQGGSY